MLRFIRPSFLTSASLLLSGAAFAGDSPLPFAEATFTEVVNDVQVVSHADAKPTRALRNAKINAPDLVKTGRKSRAQLTAADGTVARVGSNSVFAFDKSTRKMSLESGSVLFHSPSGKGGGAIVTNSATASVIGTTIIVTATADGGFKLLVLEGVAKVTYPSGQVVSLGAGQMTFVLPDKSSGEKGGQPGPVLNFDLAALVADSSLVSGFESQLASREKILESMREQGVLIEDGDLKSTGLFIVGAGGGNEFLLSDPTLIVQAQAQAQSQPETISDRLRESLRTSVNFDNNTDEATPVPERNIFRTPVRVLQDMLPAGRNVPDEDLHGILVGSLTFNGTTADFASLDGISNEITVGGLAGRTEINDNLTFTGLSQTRRLRIAGGELVIADGSQIRVLFNSSEVDLPTKAEFVSLTGAEFTGVSFENSTGEVELGTLTGNLTLNNVTVRAGLGEDQGRKVIQSQDGQTESFQSDLPPRNFSLKIQADSGDISIDSGSYSAAGEIIVRADSGDISIISGSYSAAGEIIVQASGRVAVADSTWSAPGVSVDAETIVVDNTWFNEGSTATLRTREGLLNPTYTGTPDTEITGYANLNSMNFNVNAEVDFLSMIWSPAQNIGDVTRPIHILGADAEDFRGSKIEYARTRPLTLDSASGFTPFSYLFDPFDITEDNNFLLIPSDFNLTEVPVLTSGDDSYSPYSVNGLFAKNLTLSDATVELPASEFSFTADIVAGTMILSGDITLKPDTTRELNTGELTESRPVTRSIELRAGRFEIAPGTVLNPGLVPNGENSGEVRITSLSAGALDLKDFTLENSAGSVAIESLGELNITQTATDAGFLRATGDEINLAGKSVTLTGAVIQSEARSPGIEGPGSDFETADIPAFEGSNELEVFPATEEFSTPTYLNIKGSIKVTIDGGQLKASEISVTAGDGERSYSDSNPGDTIEVKGLPEFITGTASFLGISMDASTINVRDTIFPAGTEIRLRSGSGILNLGSSLNGAVNFIRSVGVHASGSSTPTMLVDAASLPDAAGINAMVWVDGHGGTNRIYVNGAPSGPNSGLTGNAVSNTAAIHIQQIGAPQVQGITAPTTTPFNQSPQ